MKKIYLSLAMILVVGGIVWGATVAFYNDTETSNGNIFTAGSIDLKVDHTAQTYNGVDCKTCSVTLVSDTTNEVTAQIGGIDPGPFPHSAALVSSINPAWTADVDGAVNDAKWIWWTNPTPEAEKGVDTTYTFRKTFTWMGPISGATLSLATAADNGYEVWLNGVNIGSDPSEANYNAAGQDSYSGFSAAIVQGTNTLEIKVKNMLRPVGQTWDNPGGLLYKLIIDGNCGDAYFQNHCSLWEATDLTNQKFFDFGDVKPGDFGSDVISLHVDDNEAFACMLPINKQDMENLCNNAEDKVPDPSCTATNGDGELGSLINIVAWNDGASPDGIHQAGEAILYQGSIKDLLAGALTIPAGQTENIGQAWCAGSIPTMVAGDGAVVCDSNGMGNIAQTDSFLADLELYAVQTRNNPNFTCASLVPSDQ
jgi:predicted ribosomally synthesized peptide with SipW-like signal peptide